MPIEGDNIFVTGGTGFIGSHLVRRLQRKGCEVHLLVRAGSDCSRVAHLENVVLHKGDLVDAQRLKEIVQDIMPVGVFHLATSTIQSGVSAGPEELLRINVQGFVNLTQALADVPYKYLINTGSFLEVGNKNRPLKEDDLCEPKEMYSISKLAATLYGQMLAVTKQKPVATVRIFTPYGPHVQKGRLIYEVVRRATAGESINLTAPHVTRDFIFVEDIVDLLLEVASRAEEVRGEIFNAGTGVSTTLGQLVALVLAETDSQSEVVWNPSKLVSYDNGLWQADMQKTLTTFSWSPKTTLKEGIAETAAWLGEDRI